MPIISKTPFMLASLPVALFFFLMGLWGSGALKKWTVNLSSSSCVVVATLLLSAGLLVVSATLPAQTYDLRLAHFNALGLLPCMAGISLVVSLGLILARMEVAGSVLALIGRNSLCFFALEFPLADCFAKIMNHFGYHLSMWMSVAEYPVWLVFLRMAFTLSFAALLAPFVQKMLKKIKEW